MAIRSHHGVPHIEVSYVADHWRKILREMNDFPCIAGGPADGLRNELRRELHKYDERMKAASRVYGNGEPEPPIPVSDEEIDHRLGG